MNIIRFTPTQLNHLRALREAASAAAPDWASIHRRAASMQRSLLPGGARACEALAGQEWAVSYLLGVLDRSAVALARVRRSA